MKNRYPMRYPTAAELYAFEREARRLRAAEVSRLLRAGVRAVKSSMKSLVTHPISVPGGRGIRHA